MIRIEWAVLALSTGVVAGLVLGAFALVRSSVESYGESPVPATDRHWRVVRRAFLVAAVAFLLFSIYGSLIPFRLQVPDLGERPPDRWLVWSFSRTDMAANFLLMVPGAYCLMGATCLRSRKWWVLGLASLATLLVCGLVTWINEFGQLWIARRVASWTDIVMQHLGAITGVAAWWISGALVSHWVWEFASQRRSASRWSWVLELYMVGFVFYHLLPLDLTISVGEIGNKFVTGRINIIPFRDLSHRTADWVELLRDVAIYVPVGAFVTLWRTARLRSFSQSLCFGFLIAVAVEAGQVVVRSRFADSGDVLLGMLGVSLGHFLVRRLARGKVADSTAAYRWGLASIAWMLVLPVVFWYPYELTQDSGPIREAFKHFWARPFERLIMGNSTLGITVTVLRNIVAFVPLGLLLSQVAARVAKRSSVRRAATLAAGATIVAYATALELVQLVIVGRTADITDWGLFVVSGWMGLTLGLKATRQPSDAAGEESRSAESSDSSVHAR